VIWPIIELRAVEDQLPELVTVVNTSLADARGGFTHKTVTIARKADILMNINRFWSIGSSRMK
jgi:hypothetical protein